MFRLYSIGRRVVSFSATLVAIQLLFCAWNCFGDKSGRKSPCETKTSEKRRLIQTGEQAILAEKIIQHLCDKKILNSIYIHEEELFDILNKVDKEKILHTTVVVLFHWMPWLGWDRMLSCFKELDIIADLYNLGLSPNIHDSQKRMILESILDDPSNQSNLDIDLLLEKGAVISPCNRVKGGKYDSTALGIALTRNHGEDLDKLVLKLLRHNTAMRLALNDIDKGLLAYAIERGCNAAVVELFIKQGADVNEGLFTIRNITPLWAAVLKGDSAFDIVKVLIKSRVYLGPSPKDFWLNDWFPLDQAVRDGAQRLAELLKQHGAKSSKSYTYNSYGHNTTNLPPKNPAHPPEVTQAIETLNKYFTKPITIETPLQEIKNLYRKATLTCHPDKTLGEKEEQRNKLTDKFKELSKAMATLEKYLRKTKTRKT